MSAASRFGESEWKENTVASGSVKRAMRVPLIAQHEKSDKERDVWTRGTGPVKFAAGCW